MNDVPINGGIPIEPDRTDDFRVCKCGEEISVDACWKNYGKNHTCKCGRVYEVEWDTALDGDDGSYPWASVTKLISEPPATQKGTQ